MANGSLFAFAPELRNKIYREVLSDDTVVQLTPHIVTCLSDQVHLHLAKRIVVQGSLISGLLESCRQARAETYHMAFNLGTLVLDMDRVSAVRYLQAMPSAVRDRITRISVRSGSHRLKPPYVDDTIGAPKKKTTKDPECYLLGRYLLANMTALQEVTLWPESIEETEWYYTARDIVDLICVVNVLHFCYATPATPFLPAEFYPIDSLQIPSKFLHVQEEVDRRSRGARTIRITKQAVLPSQQGSNPTLARCELSYVRFTLERCAAQQ